MNAGYENFATSSFLLYLDNRLCSNTGFYNVGTQAFPINTIFNGYTTYSFPFNQIISDRSINCNHLSGIFLNGSWITPGQSGWSATNFEKGQLYFTGNNPIITSVSGNYAIKEINLRLTDFPDINVLFETKLSLRPKFPENLSTGLLNNIFTYPCAFIDNGSGPTNSPFILGGVDQTRSIFDIYLFCDSLYQKNACMSIMKDIAWKYIPLLNNAYEMPFNSFGDYKSGIPYNYNTLTKGRIGSGMSMLVESVDVTEWGRRSFSSEITSMTQEAFFLMVSITAWTARVTK